MAQAERAGERANAAGRQDPKEHDGLYRGGARLGRMSTPAIQSGCLIAVPAMYTFLRYERRLGRIHVVRVG
jgi:hypothetical protein